MKFICRNDLRIVPITETQYIAQFGARFDEAGEDAPAVHDTLELLIDEALDLFDLDEIREMISAQTDAFYRDAILIRAIAAGKLDMAAAEQRLIRDLKNTRAGAGAESDWQEGWAADLSTATVTHKSGFTARFLNIKEGVVEEYAGEIVVGVCRTRDGKKWLAVTTTSSLQQHDREMVRELGENASRMWSVTVLGDSPTVMSFAYTNNFGVDL